MDKRAEITEKTRRLTRMLAAEGLGGVVLVAQPNFAWLTAGGNNGIDTSREQGACALVFGAVGRSLTPGVTENEIARRVSDALAARGMRSVVTLVAADERIGKFRHPVPSEKTWERVVMLVTCARRQGLVASLSRIVCAGEVP